MNTKTTEWKMVRPTLEMISAGSNAQVAASSDDEFDQPDDYINVWRDAPTPQAKPCERCAELEAEAKARKQAQADLETYKGRCTDLEHQNERLEAENERGDAAANEIDRLRSDLSTAKAAPTPQVSEPVYAYRRKGLSYFCTCERKQYEELATKPNMFEVTIFYPTPQHAKPCERCAELERIKELEGEIDKERQRRWAGNAESSRELAELNKQLAAQKVIDAAGNLIAQKGRHNTEIAYKRLAKAIAAQKEGK